MRRRTIAGFLRVGVLLASGPAVALAATDVCTPAPTTKATIPPAKPLTDSLVHVRADKATVVRRNVVVFSGHVQVRYGSESLLGDRVEYDRTTGIMKARGHVVLYDQHGDRVHTGRLDFNPLTYAGRSGRVVFEIANQSGHGYAKSIDFKSQSQLVLGDAHYTSCPPGHSAWFIVTQKLQLDRANNVGTARNARVDFKGVPLFFWPYLSFPLSNQRKSGFLAPRYGARGNAGLAFAIPYYWNIAPQLDDTITARFYSRRGLQWQNETRYLGQEYTGNLTWQYLHNDRIYRGNRYSVSFLHSQVFSPDLLGTVNYQKVSDLNYLGDFAESLAVSAQTDLPQEFRLNYSGPTWTVTGIAARFQNLDPTVPAAQLPYQRLPEIRFAADPPSAPGQIHYALTGQVDNFQGNPIIDGRRLDLFPTVSYPVRGADGFFVPTLGVRQTDYALQGVGATHITRTLPVISIDNGLYMDRLIDGGKYRQTLEPRLYYLYIPYVNQDNIPNFDTITPDFNFSNLFLANRFFGADRVGDANEATLATTSRILDQKGVERVRASLGRIFYITPPRVALPLSPVYQNKSDWVAEAVARLSQSWSLRSGVQWETKSSKVKLSDVSVQYEPAPDRILNLGHEYIAGVQDQLSISAQWPIYHRWTAVGENQYSLLNKTNLESYLGIQYNSCCWAARVYFHRQFSPTLAQIDSVMFQFELTGLAALGSPPINPLAEGAFVFGRP